MDHAIFRRRAVPAGNMTDLECDVFISSYNASDRVNRVFTDVRAARAIWLLHGEYEMEASTGGPENGERIEIDNSLSEVEGWLQVVNELGLDSLGRRNARIAIDITGMMVPHLLVMPLIMARCGFATVEIVYSEPVSYASGSRTQFSFGGVEAVRQVQGFEGAHIPTTDSDELIIGAGYDDELIRSVAESKRTCQHYVMLGLPSLRPHMYQESQVRLASAAESLNRFGDGSLLFAPANDPFATAGVLQEHAKLHFEQHGTRNRYLCPVATKCQALGFAWFYLTEARGSATSMLYPFGRRYYPDTAVGLARSHVFTLELDCLMPD